VFTKRNLYKVGLAILLLVLLLLYKEFKPGEAAYFPDCPFKKITGLDCAGCGTQRAVHYILNGDIKSAWAMNPLLLLSIPYIAFGLSYSKVIRNSELKSKIRNKLYGLRSTYFWLTIIILFWIGRNLI